MKRKRIAIVATGGTIAGAGEVGRSLEYRAGEISVSEIIESIPNINALAELECHQLFSLDSNEMDPDKWLVLARTINDLLDRDDIDGCVVTHGTDTLDETSYFLNLTISSDKPVVLTGAMRPATATSADGPFNLYQSVALAASAQAVGKGVMALFSSTIYSGRDIEKINNFRVDAFNHKDFGCLGFMQDDDVYFYSRVYRKHTFESIFSEQLPEKLPRVAVAYFCAGADPDILYHLSERNEGIVIAGTGSGNYSEAWLSAINELSSKGIVFVRSSRVNMGIVFDDEIFDPKHLCIASNTLSAQKARVLLMLCLSRTKDLGEIKRIFEEY